MLDLTSYEMLEVGRSFLDSSAVSDPRGTRRFCSPSGPCHSTAPSRLWTTGIPVPVAINTDVDAFLQPGEDQTTMHQHCYMHALTANSEDGVVSCLTQSCHWMPKRNMKKRPNLILMRKPECLWANNPCSNRGTLSALGGLCRVPGR